MYVRLISFHRNARFIAVSISPPSNRLPSPFLSLLRRHRIHRICGIYSFYYPAVAVHILHSAKYKLSIHLLYTHHKINMGLYIIAYFSLLQCVSSYSCWLITLAVRQFCLNLLRFDYSSSVTLRMTVEKWLPQSASDERAKEMPNQLFVVKTEEQARRHENIEPSCLGRFFSVSVRMQQNTFCRLFNTFLGGNYSFVHVSRLNFADKHTVQHHWARWLHTTYTEIVDAHQTTVEALKDNGNSCSSPSSINFCGGAGWKREQDRRTVFILWLIM